MAAVLRCLTGPLAPVFRLGLEHSASLAAVTLEAAAEAAAAVEGEGEGEREGEPWSCAAVRALASLQVRLSSLKFWGLVRQGRGDTSLAVPWPVFSCARLLRAPDG